MKVVWISLESGGKSGHGCARSHDRTAATLLVALDVLDLQCDACRLCKSLVDASVLHC